ncbi:hypothetical protein H5410_032475 [Solanum commersonii]|uniref:Uncharacterized protein n=1 Tax=Solanum commersonii TaxID=4109 RepID=A0A9J5YL62_SOLCO|nr:hypothetical protein H5410_032475 [Solanum commersonii]
MAMEIQLRKPHNLEKIGDGLKTDFRDDIWTGQSSLKNLFTKLYSISLKQQTKVNQILEEQGWNLNFKRSLNDWEIKKVTNLLQILEPFKITPELQDKPSRKLNSKKIFLQNYLVASELTIFVAN